MPFITTPERIGREDGKKEGLREGLLQGIRSLLRMRFPEQWEQLLGEVSRVEDLERLRAIPDAIETAATPDELRRAWSQ